MRNIIASLDVGTDSIKLIVAEVVKNKVNILATSFVDTVGVHKGVIVNRDELISSLKSVFKNVEDILGLSVRKVIVTVPSFDAEFMISDGSTTITNEDKVIKGIDVVRAMQASIYNKIPNGYEVVHIIPTGFVLNESEKVKNPINVIADKLTVKTVVSMIPKKDINAIVSCLSKIGVDVIDISLTSLGDYYCFKNDKINNMVGTIINIGDATTTVSIFNKGVLTNTVELEIGGQNIDNDISFIYKVASKDARELKENFGLAHKRTASASASRVVTNKLGEEVSINQYELSEIIMSRLEEILNIAKKQINHLTKKEIHYIIITGGVSEMADFELTMEDVFGKSAKLANVHEIGVRNNKYSAALGLIKYYNSKLKLRDKSYSIFTLEELEELCGKHKKINISDNSVLGKLFGYFFDN